MSEEERVVKLGLYMLKLGYSAEEFKACLNALSIIKITEVLTKINKKKGEDED